MVVAGAKTQGAVQSVERAFFLLEQVAEAGDLSLTELSALVELPAPTTHRLLKTLVSLGYVRQLVNRRYGLGLGLIRLSDWANTQFIPLARPHLEALARTTGESANLAVLEGNMIVYIAQAPSPHAMRMFTEPGHRAFTHSTGVGKAILAELPSEQVRKIIDKVGMPVATANTITNLAALTKELRVVKDQGYSIDDAEQEVGVRCYAVPVRGLPIPMALSVSGPMFRMSTELGDSVVPLLKAEAEALATELLGDVLP